MPNVVVLRFDLQRINRNAGNDKSLLVGIKIRIKKNASGAQRCQGLQQYFGFRFIVLATVNLETQRRMSAGVDVEHGSCIVEFRFVTLDVGSRAVRELLFSGKESEANRVLWLDSQ